MKEKVFAVRRRPFGPFVIALVGVPLMAIMYDFLTGSHVLIRFGELIYRDEVEAFEARDLIWAAAFGIVGTLALAWGLRELLFPRRVLIVDDSGLLISVGGPFGSLVRVPWADVDDMRVGELTIDEETKPSIDLTILDRALLPENPWGARWRDGHTLAIDAGSWDKTPEAVVAEFDSRRRAATILRSTALHEDQGPTA